MTDKQNHRSGAKGAPAIADEYQEVSYFAWQRRFPVNWADGPQAAELSQPNPASGSRSF